MIGTNKEKAYNDAKKCLDQLLANDQIPFYGYVEIMIQLDQLKNYHRMIGRWINDRDVYFTCSICRNTCVCLYDYCPHCGAKMEVK